jgi:hypothetical protein
MTAHALYLEATRLGLRLEPRGDKLAVIPGDCVPPEFASPRFASTKTSLLEWLTRPPCHGWGTVPPDTLPLNAATPCPTSQKPRTRHWLLGFDKGATGPAP